MALIFMDYPNQGRLKVFGRARIVDTRDAPQLAESLAVPGYRAVIERAVYVTVAGFDWNCPQHITPRYTVMELNAILGPSWQQHTAESQRERHLTADVEQFRTHERTEFR